MKGLAYWHISILTSRLKGYREGEFNTGQYSTMHKSFARNVKTQYILQCYISGAGGGSYPGHPDTEVTDGNMWHISTHSQDIRHV